MEELNEMERNRIEKELLDRARNYWDEFYPRTEANDLAKMRIYSKEGMVQGVVEHTIKKQWYAKQGYWEDGTTTLEERKKELILQKIEFGKKISVLQDSYISNFEEIEERIKSKKERVSKIPTLVKQKFGINRKELLDQYTLELERVFDAYIEGFNEKVEEIYVEMVKDFKLHKGKLVTDLQDKIRKLHQESKSKIENSIKEYGAELEAELIILNSKENDDRLLRQYQEEVKKINQEINSLIPMEDIEEDDELNLEDFTVPALKELADQRGIKYDARIRKSELIDLLG